MKRKIIKLVIAFLISLLFFLSSSITANSDVIEIQTVTENKTVSCSVYCYVAEEPESIVIPKVFIEEPVKKVRLIDLIIDKIKGEL
jgi:hypothetical protein